MELPGLFLVFDVESVGLHGEGFAWGAVVVGRDGEPLVTARAACPPESARGPEDGRIWVRANVPPLKVTAPDPRSVRDEFWAEWREWAENGAVLVADCAWPVEARFLAACVDDDPAARAWQGPYPLHDLASIRLAAGLDPLAREGRRDDELPEHDPLCDARQSARLLCEALSRIRQAGGR